LNFAGATFSCNTHAYTSLGGQTSGSWTLYETSAIGENAISFGTNDGASLTPVAGGADVASQPLTWELDSLGTRTSCVHFALDVVATGRTNGVVDQRALGVSDLRLTVPPERTPTPSFAWNGLCATVAAAHYNDKTYDECDNLCKELEGCTGFAFNEVTGVHCKTFTADLKKWTATTYQSFKCYDAHPPVSKWTGLCIDRTFNTEYGYSCECAHEYKSGVVSVTECEKYCEDLDGCTAFAYNKAHGSCKTYTGNSISKWNADVTGATDTFQNYKCYPPA
jgi:hypothetical protein